MRIRPSLVALAVALALAGCDDPTPNAARADATTTPAASAGGPAPGSGVIAATARWGSGGKADVDPSHQLDDNYFVVFDGSGSMQSRECGSGRYADGRVGDARQAVLAFGRSLPATANLALLVFDTNGYRLAVPLGQGEANRQAFERAASGVRAGGGTPLGPAVRDGFKALAQQAERQGGYGTYHEVIETDGQPDSMPELVKALDAVYASPVVVETIGFCMDGDTRHPLNQPGRTVYYSARDPQQVQADLKAIVAETDAFKVDDAGVSP